MTLRIFCVVEGHGETTALPQLVRRICGEVLDNWDVVVEMPYRLPKGKFASALELQKAVKLGAARLKERAMDNDRLLVLISRDADDECPIHVKQQIDERIRDWDTDGLHQAVIPNEEFEVWLLAGAAGLTGHPDCVDNIPAFENVESIGSPKSVFERRVLKAGRTYSETVDQEKFAAQISLDQGVFAKSRSLRRLREVLHRASQGQTQTAH